jgi:hypothetical protein
MIFPQGLDIERQWYLYNNIRDLIVNKNKADDVAPLPKERISKPTKTSMPLKSKKEKLSKSKREKKTTAS